MRKTFVFILSVLLIFSGFFILFQVLGKIIPKGTGALQVTANIPAKVILNGKFIGNVQLCKCDENDRIQTGNYVLEIIPEQKYEKFTVNIKISKNVLTAVDRTFLPGSFSSASTLYLEKIPSNNPQLFVSSIPNGALVTLDGKDTKTTPYLETNITSSRHEIELQKGGYAKKTLRVKTIPGYKLIVEAILGTQPEIGEVLPGSETTPTPTPTPEFNTVTILSTPTGFLRVRSEANINAKEIGRVNPEDNLPLLEETEGWFKIKLDNGNEGWISSEFAQKNTTQ